MAYRRLFVVVLVVVVALAVAAPAFAGGPIAYPTPDIDALGTQFASANINPNTAMTWSGPLFALGGLFLVMTVGLRWAPRLLGGVRRMAK